MIPRAQMLKNHFKLQSPMIPVVDLPNRHQIRLGSSVGIETKEDQGTGEITEGIVDQILTRHSTHPYGIKVRLENGSIGRVKKITGASRMQKPKNPSKTAQFEDLSKKAIPKTENHYNEFKEFYQYDGIMGRSWSVGADRKKSVFKDKKLEVQARFATAVCSFGNADGGFVYLGIRSDGTVAGLEKDKKLGGFADYEDEFANHIVTRLKELVGDNVFVMNKIKIEFKQIDDKTVCLVQVLPAVRPLHLHRNKVKEFYVRGAAPRAERLDGLDEARYIRERFPDFL